MGDRKRHIAALGVALLASAAVASSANYTYTMLPTSAGQVTLGVAFTITANGSILYEASYRGQLGYAVANPQGFVHFHVLGEEEGAQSMNDDTDVVVNGPSGSFTIDDSNNREAFSVNGDRKSFLWGINDNDHICGEDKNNGFIWNGTNTILVHYPNSYETMCRGISNNDQLCGSYFVNNKTHGWYWNKHFFNLDYPGAGLTVASSINNFSHVVGYYQPGQAQVEERGGFVYSYGQFQDVTLPAPPSTTTAFDPVTKHNETFNLDTYWVEPMSINDSAKFVVARIGYYENEKTGSKTTRYWSFLSTPKSMP